MEFSGYSRTDKRLGKKSCLFLLLAGSDSRSNSCEVTGGEFEGRNGCVSVVS